MMKRDVKRRIMLVGRSSEGRTSLKEINQTTLTANCKLLNFVVVSHGVPLAIIGVGSELGRRKPYRGPFEGRRFVPFHVYVTHMSGTKGGKMMQFILPIP